MFLKQFCKRDNLYLGKLFNNTRIDLSPVLIGSVVSSLEYKIETVKKF